MTEPHRMEKLRARTQKLVLELLACGIDPDRSTIFLDGRPTKHLRPSRIKISDDVISDIDQVSVTTIRTLARPLRYDPAHLIWANRDLFVLSKTLGGRAVALQGIERFPSSPVCHDAYSAHQGVEHDAMNVLALGARVVGEALALELLRAFLDACPSDEERHCRRIAKRRAIEARTFQGDAHDRPHP